MSKATRKVPMQVIALGLSRTGTCSIQSALQTLGIPCFHYLDLMERPSDCDKWSRALDAKFYGKGHFDREDWDDLLANYGAASDMPTYALGEELINTYPEAKVLLVSRNIDSWYRSFDQHVITEGFQPYGHYMVYLDPFWFGRLRWLAEKVMETFFRARTQEEMRRNAKDVFREHYARVRKITPPERLLELDLTEGWKPLCDFLGKEVPDVPFPRINEAAEAKARMLRTVKDLWKRSARNVSLCALIMLSGWSAWRWAA